MAELTQNEKRLLATLVKEHKADAPHLATILDTTPESVVQWAHLAEDKGLVSLGRIVDKVFVYTDEGKEYLNKGLPETQLLKFCRNDTPLVDLQKHAAFRIGFGQLRKKGLISVKNGVVFKVGEPSTADDEAALKNPQAGGQRTKDLIKRGILQATESVRYTVSINPEGLALAKQGLDMREETGTLTRDQILSGGWKDANLRRYDVIKLPKRVYPGKIHPYQRLIEDMRQILLEMGFTEIYGNIVQSSFWNFDALFQPQDHPAREMQDTFYLKELVPLPFGWERVRDMHERGGETSSTGWGGIWNKEKAEQCVLRTHTTSLSIQHLAANPNPPVKAFCISRVYRRETIDPTHTPEFEQLEGIVMDKGVSFRHLLGYLKEFYGRMGFEDIRFRPGYFPYTEPSVEPEIYVDGLGWVEMGGAGIFREEVTAPWGSRCEPRGHAEAGIKGPPPPVPERYRVDKGKPGSPQAEDGKRGKDVMAVIGLPYKYLEHLTGTDKETILARLPMIGSDIERQETDHADVEFFPNRPDLFSVEGVARAMRGFLDIETGLPRYTVKPSGIKFTIDPNLTTIRPYLGSAIIRNVSFDEESILSIMGLQEALHWAVGRGRSKVAIGIHDLDTIEPPFHYIASARNRKFIPLDFDRELSMDEILAEHPKGRDFAKIVKDFPLFPLIIDNKNNVCSFPPIINGERTRVTTNTRNILLDTTGTDQKAVQVAVNIICTAMVETGAILESVDIDGVQTPTLMPAAREVRVRECCDLIGVELSAMEIATLLEKMRFGAQAVGTDIVNVQVPCYRADIMHDWDIFEDVAIAYGYDKFAADISPTFAIGRAYPVYTIAIQVRAILAGLGYLEMMPFTLTNKRVLFDAMQREQSSQTISLMYPISEEHTVVRTDILPLLLEMLQVNKPRELPQRLFATGDIITDLKTVQRLAVASIHPNADFSEAYACADAILHELSILYTVKESDDPAFISGRRGDIIAGGKKVGVFGEIHPAVLNAFELEYPVAAFELDLRAVPGYPDL